MKKAILVKAAFDFAFANYSEADKVKLAQSSLEAFQSAGFDQKDLIVWNTIVANSIRMYNQASMQPLPSEATASIVMPRAMKIDAPVTPIADPAAPAA